MAGKLKDKDKRLTESRPGDEAHAMPDDRLELAADVYNGLSDGQIAEVERIALDRREFFGEDEAR